MEHFIQSDDKTIQIINQWSKISPEENKGRDEHYMRVMKILFGEKAEELLENAEQKAKMEMNVGYYIQDFIGNNLKGHVNYGQSHESGLDGENNLGSEKIIYEIKTGGTTMNSSSLYGCITKLKNATKDNQCKPLLIQFFRKSKITHRGKYADILITGEDYLNKYVSPEIGGVEGLVSYMEKIKYNR